MIPMVRRNGMMAAPWEELTALRREMTDLLGSAQARASGVWAPPVGVREDDESIYVELELPGVRPESVDITLEQRVLTVAGEKRDERQSESNGYRHVERRFGRFERTFTLGRDVDADRVAADYENGVLTIRMPKLETAKPRRIPVGGGEGRRLENNVSE